MQHYYNHAELVGRLHGEINAVTNKHGDTIFDGTLAVQRQSGTFDYLPISIPAELVGGAPYKHMLSMTKVAELYGRHLRLRGELRSYNKEVQSKSRHYTVMHVQEISDAEQPADDNRVAMQGVICRPTVYRETPLGRKICDFMIAVNHDHRSSYIPCICWGRAALKVSALEVGTLVNLRGRFQSREYQKVLDNGETVTRTTNEVSCNRVCIAVQEGAEV